MVTTQFQMDEDTFEALRKYADKQKKPISIVAGEMLKNILTQPHKHTEQISETDLLKKYPWIGLGKSDETDMSVRHDDYLADY